MKMIYLDINDQFNYDLNITIRAVTKKLNIDLDEFNDALIEFARKFVEEMYSVEDKNINI